WSSGSPQFRVALYRVLRIRYSAIRGLFSNTDTSGRRAGRGSVNSRLICEDARNTGRSKCSYARRKSWTARRNEIFAAKNGLRHSAAIAPLRRAKEIPSPTKG